MDKRIIIFVFIFNIVNSFGQQIIYQKGQVYNKIPINKVDSNGLKQGIWVYVFNKFKYYSVVKYKSDTIVDTVKIFSFKNNLLNITQYKNGRKNGFYFDYDNKGRIKEERYYKNDTLNGHVKIYFNGKIFSETIYKNGLPFYTKYFYKNGNIKSEYFNSYVEINNEMHPIDTLIKIYFKNGKIKKEISLNLNKSEIIYKEVIFRKNGTRKKEIYLYNGGKKIIKKYRKNGKLYKIIK